MLCEKCIHVQLPHQQDWKNKHICLVRHHSTFEDLLASAAKGCELCRYFQPFIENAKSKRSDNMDRNISHCPCDPGDDDHSICPLNPFDGVPYDPTVLFDIELSKMREGGRQFPVEEGGYYLYEATDDEYLYCETESNRDAQREHMKSSEIKCDDAAYIDELSEHLRLLGLSASPKPSRPQPQESEDLDEPGHELLLWLLATKQVCDGPEQLWLTITHNSPFCDLDQSTNDDYCTVVLTAGSIEGHDDFNAEMFCINGVRDYSIFKLASAYPELWKYRPNQLTKHQGPAGECSRPVLEFCQRREDNFVTIPPLYSKQVDDDPGSPKVLGLARSWLDECLASHPACKPAKGLSIPARLIDVGGMTDTEAKLFIGQPHDNGLHYAALSHCWGREALLMTKLRSDNLNSMMQGFAITDLAKNFQDAINITRGLSLKYLWIDALCIMQDSEQDWAAEAANMGSYFRRAEVTICAVSASHSQEGILCRRNKPIIPLQIRTEWGPVYLRPLLPDSVWVTDADAWARYRPDMHSRPWNQRAWTLQERLFSQRKLYFTDKKMIWQCRSRFFSEDGQYTSPNNFPVSRQDQGSIVDLLDYRRARDANQKSSKRPNISSMKWYDLINSYTQRIMTFQKDRLPALSSLARDIADITGARYVAGIWIGSTKTTVTSLLWQPDHSSGKISYANNGSPTWSWTSVVGQIFHPLEDHHILSRPNLDSRIVKVEVFPATADMFGRLVGGEYEIECWIHRYAGLRTYQSLLETVANQERTFDARKRIEDGDLDSPSDDPLAEFDIEKPSDFWRPKAPLQSSDMVSKSQSLALRPSYFVLALIAHANYAHQVEEGWDHCTVQSFLLLEKSNGGPAEAYKRAGTATTYEGAIFTINEDNGWRREIIVIT